MKIIDNFLKKLGASRNTFATYILTLLTVYIAVDRIVEMLLMIFTGVSFSYWGPIEYTLALACPVFAYLFSGASEFASSKAKKVTLFYIYIIGLYIIALSMFTQWLNMGVWLFLLSVPDYVDLVTEFSEVVKPALRAISLYLPLMTLFPLFKWLYFGVNDTTDQVRSIWDYGGIDLSNKSEGRGPYSCEVYLCNDDETGKSIVIPESSRYQSLFVCGGSGTGKTALIYEHRRKHRTIQASASCRGRTRGSKQVSSHRLHQAGLRSRAETICREQAAGIGREGEGAGSGGIPGA